MKTRKQSKFFPIARLGLMLILLVGMIIVAHAGNSGGDALEFAGATDQHVKVTNNSRLQPTTAITYEAWVKPSAFISWGGIIDNMYWTDTTYGGFSLMTLASGRFAAYLYTTSLQEIGGAYCCTDTHRWYHVAVTYDDAGDNTARMYINGTVQGDTPTSGGNIDYTNVNLNSAYGLNIGYFRDNNDHIEFNGQIDEVRIWNVALSQTQIQTNMFKELTGSESGLVAYYKFNDGTGSTAVDSAGGDDTGTLTNMDPATDWVSSTAPIGDSTVGSQTDVAAMWLSNMLASNTSASSSGLTIANSTFLQDTGDDFVFGHNNLTGNSTEDLPGGVVQRWQRIWYFDKTDLGTAGGNVDITFDFSDGGMGGGSGPGGTVTNYKLLQRAGTSGNFSITASASSISGDQVIFTGVNSTLLGSYYTLGTTDTTNSPLGDPPTAVTLSDFTARSPGGGNGFVLPLALVALGAVGGMLLRRRRRK